MSTIVNYKGNTIATLNNETKTLTTAGTWVEDNIEIRDARLHTATITTAGYNDNMSGMGSYVRYNNNNYYNLNTEIIFYEGDILEIVGVHYDDTYVMTLYVDGNEVEVQTSSSRSHTYNYVSSNCDITIDLSSSRGDQTVYINTVTTTLNLQSKTATPTESTQTITPDTGYDGLSSVEVGSISSSFVGSGIDRRSSTDLTVSGATVTSPAGYYAESASKSVASGSATTPATSITANPNISVSSGGLITATTSASQSVTPTVNAGYVTSGTSGTVSVSGSKTQQLTTQAAKTVTPTESEQTAVASGVYTTGIVKVGAISSTYVGSGIEQRDDSDLTVSGATVTAPSGYYEESVSKSVASGSAGTPTASKGTVTNHSISVTPSVTNTTGYITGGTKTGTAVTVTASELASGNKEITSNGTNIDVVGYSTVSVAVPSSSAAIITDTTDAAGGTIRTITTTDEVHLQTKTITPTSSQQTVLPDTGYDGFSSVIVGASSGGGSGNVEIEIISENLHDSSEDVTNTYINGSAESSYNNWTSTGYIPVKSDTYYCVKNTPGNKYNAFYKSDKTSAKASVVVPESSTADDYVLIKTTSNTAYIRMSGASSGVANYEIYEVNVVEAGSSTPSATAHTIYFEFSDSTNTSITAYYDSTFISSAITATEPTTYGGKTVTLAQLDGVTWYEVSGDIPLNTELVDYTAVTSGKYVDESSGAIVNGESWDCVTDYIKIDPSMTFSFISKAWYGIGFYNTSKTPIRGYSANDLGTASGDYVHGTISPSVIPSNAVYCVLTGNPYSLTSNSLSLIRTA